MYLYKLNGTTIGGTKVEKTGNSICRKLDKMINKINYLFALGVALLATFSLGQAQMSVDEFDSI